MRSNTSWSPVADWYGKIVGSSGHYFHQHVILPGLKKIINLKIGEKVLDVGCGQGVYARAIDSRVSYIGVDISEKLIEEARRLDKNKRHTYIVADARQSLPVPPQGFDHVVSILALQNIEDAAGAIANMVSTATIGGDITLVINHPCFRIPRQSSWGVDDTQKLEYRRINRYMSPLKIPINAHPGDEKSPITWTFHEPLSYYINALTTAGCVVNACEEWVSDKESQGKARMRENRARSEFPLFLTLQAIRLR